MTLSVIGAAGFDLQTLASPSQKAKAVKTANTKLHCGWSGQIIECGMKHATTWQLVFRSSRL